MGSESINPKFTPMSDAELKREVKEHFDAALGLRMIAVDMMRAENVDPDVASHGPWIDRARVAITGLNQFKFHGALSLIKYCNDLTKEKDHGSVPTN